MADPAAVDLVERSARPFGTKRHLIPGHGMGFDGSSITGFNAIEESDMIAQPDPSTFIALPSRPNEAGVARMFCDILYVPYVALAD